MIRTIFNQIAIELIVLLVYGHQQDTHISIVVVYCTSHMHHCYASCIVAIINLSKAMIPMLLSREHVPQELDIDQAKGLNMMMLVLNTITAFRESSHNGILTPLCEIISKPDDAKVSILQCISSLLLVQSRN